MVSDISKFHHFPTFASIWVGSIVQKDKDKQWIQAFLTFLGQKNVSSLKKMFIYVSFVTGCHSNPLLQPSKHRFWPARRAGVAKGEYRINHWGNHWWENEFHYTSVKPTVQYRFICVFFVLMAPDKPHYYFPPLSSLISTLKRWPPVEGRGITWHTV